jgi:hypothetical protein
MNLHQRLYRLEQHQPEVSEQGLFSDNAQLLVSVVDGNGNELYGILETFNKPHGSTSQRLTLEQLTTLKATV